MVYSQNYSGGAGTLSNPYLVSNFSDLQYLSEHSTDWIKHFKQTATIDASVTLTMNVGDHDNNVITPDEAMGFSPIGTIIGNVLVRFKGNYDGQGYEIKNLHINRPGFDAIGLFGLTENNFITNVNLVNVSIVGGNYFVGSLIGATLGSEVRKSIASGMVQGGDMVGGLIGQHKESSMFGCYSLVNVTGNDDIGGLVGYDEYGNVDSSYAHGATFGTSNVGGLIGRLNEATITHCYSIGQVNGSINLGGLVGFNTNAAGIIVRCFYDSQTSGRNDTGKGTPKTTSEMKAQSTYFLWDFVVETINGTNDVWKMSLDCPNQGYPIFSWQNTSSLPSQPSAITGSISLCDGTSASYSVTNDASATSYEWSLPFGWLGNSDSSSIVLTPNGTGSGIFTIGVRAVNACGISQLQSITIDVLAPTSSTINQTSCDSYTAPDGAVYNTSGTKAAVVTNTAGCDSTITINLTINNSTAATLTTLACGIYTAPDGAVYTTSGTKTALITNAAGCDSIITINLTIHTSPLQPSITQAGNTLTCSLAGLSYQWYLDGNPISGETNQSYEIIQDGNYTVEIIDANTCSNISNTFNATYTGIDEFSTNHLFIVYPNPSTGKFSVIANGAKQSQIQKLEVYNIIGSLVISEMATANSVNGSSLITVDLSSYSNGIYFLNCKVENETQTIKIIKQ
jgi:hypothetical protein